MFRYCPVWPNSAFLQRTGLTWRTPDASCVIVSTAGAGEVVVSTAGAGVVTESAGLIASVVAVVGNAGVVTEFDEPEGAMVDDVHDWVSRFLILPNSLWSILSCQRNLMATHSDK